MMRKIAIGLAAVVISTAGSTLSASAIHGGGGGHDGKGGGGHGGGFVHGGGGGHGHLGPHTFGMHKPPFKHHKNISYDIRIRSYTRYGGGGYRGGGSYRSGSYGGGSCWTRVWTPEGWRSRNVCGHGRPSYEYGRGGSYGYQKTSIHIHKHVTTKGKGGHH
jgi:hypothetical protein